MSEFALKVAATLMTAVSVFGSLAYVLTHVKNPEGPLQPPVVRATPAPATSSVAVPGRPTLAPSVRTAELPAITWTHVS